MMYLEKHCANSALTTFLITGKNSDFYTIFTVGILSHEYF